MWCGKCGNEISDDAKFCNACGAPVMQAQEQEQTPYVYDASQTTYIYNTNTLTTFPRENSSGLLLAAFIFNLISTIGFAVLIIPLAWCIPMTIHSYGVYKGTKPNTVGFGVCTLIFVSLIGGILMLVADKDA